MAARITNEEAMKAWATKGITYTACHLIILGYEAPYPDPTQHQRRCQVLLDIFKKAPDFTIHKWTALNGPNGMGWSDRVNRFTEGLGNNDLVVIFFDGNSYSTESQDWTMEISGYASRIDAEELISSFNDRRCDAMFIFDCEFRTRGKEARKRKGGNTEICALQSPPKNRRKQPLPDESLVFKIAKNLRPAFETGRLGRQAYPFSIPELLKWDRTTGSNSITSRFFNNKRGPGRRICIDRDRLVRTGELVFKSYPIRPRVMRQLEYGVARRPRPRTHGDEGLFMPVDDDVQPLNGVLPGAAKNDPIILL